MPEVCIKSCKRSDNRFYLVASSRPMHALRLDTPVLFLFKRSTTETKDQEGDEDQGNDDSFSSENECSDKALMAASKELMSALHLYGTRSRVHIPFFDNQTSYLKLIIRQEKIGSKNTAWHPGKWSQEVIVESMEWKPSLFLFRCVIRKFSATQQNSSVTCVGSHTYTTTKKTIQILSSQSLSLMKTAGISPDVSG